MFSDGSLGMLECVVVLCFVDEMILFENLGGWVAWWFYSNFDFMGWHQSVQSTLFELDKSIGLLHFLIDSFLITTL